MQDAETSRAQRRRAGYGAGCLALLAAFVAVVHAPVERADFSLDDFDYVAGNPSIRSLASALSAFAAPFPPQLPEKRLYRPLTNLTYAADYALWRDDGWGYHATNVALYVAVVWLVFALGIAYTASLPFALALALVFAAHPVHCEAVDSVSGRSEVLALGCALVSLLLFMRAVHRSTEASDGLALGQAFPLLVGSALAYACSALAKETGAVLPAVLAVHFLVYGRRAREAWGRWAARGAAFLALHGVVAIGYLAARYHALHAFAPPSAAGSEWDRRLFALGLVVFHDFRLLVWPSVLHVDFYWESLFLRPRDSLLEFLLGCLLLALALRSFGSWLRDQIRTPAQPESRRISLCGLAILLVFFAPVSHLFPIGTKMGERLLFAPSLGFSLLLVVAARGALRRFIERAPTRRLIAALFVAAIAAVAGARSHARALEWRDDLRLWKTEERALPGDPRVLSNLAIAYLKRDRWDESRDALERARHSDLRIEGFDRVLDNIEELLRRRRLRFEP